MAGYSVIESGNYDLEVDTGYLWDGFVLDSDTKGVLNNTEFVLTGTTQYASVMDGTISLSAKRGRRDIGDQFTFGTLNFTLNDTLADGIFTRLIRLRLTTIQTTVSRGLHHYAKSDSRATTR